MVGKLESQKDTVQVLTESMATRVGNIAGIVTGAVRDVTREIGDWASDVFEMREASRKAVDRDALDRDALDRDALDRDAD